MATPETEEFSLEDFDLIINPPTLEEQTFIDTAALQIAAYHAGSYGVHTAVTAYNHAEWLLQERRKRRKQYAAQ